LASIIDLLVKIQVLGRAPARRGDEPAPLSAAGVTSCSRSPRWLCHRGDRGARGLGGVELGPPDRPGMTPPEGPALALLDARICATSSSFRRPARERRAALAGDGRPHRRGLRSDWSGAGRRSGCGPRSLARPRFLRAVRALYGAPGAESTQPEPVQNDKARRHRDPRATATRPSKC